MTAKAGRKERGLHPEAAPRGLHGVGEGRKAGRELEAERWPGWRPTAQVALKRTGV